MTPNFFRSLSQRLKSKNRQSHPHHHQPELKQPQQQLVAEIITLKDTQCQCRIQLLDQTDMNLAVEKTALGQELYSRVFAYLDLDERDYFGLQFTDHFQVKHWLDPAKRIRKQIPIGPPYTLRFRVKFFPNEPVNLRDELTRYLFFLQLQQDIQIGRLECPKATATELSALRLQSEFGDFNTCEHSQTFVSEFRYHPLQDRQMEFAILRHWSSGGQMQGFSPSQAEMAFLEKARQLPLYGVDLHSVLGRDGQQYRLGLSPQGMLVLDGVQKIGLFLWEKIQRLDFRGRRLSLVVEEDLPTQQTKRGQLVQLHTFLFHLSSSRAAKHLWKCAIEFHTFFRLKYLRAPQQQRRVLPSLLRLGSTFRYRGRTEYETIQRKETTINKMVPTIGHQQRAESAERPGHVFRRPSRRYAPMEPLNPIDSRRNGPLPGPTLIPVRTSASTSSFVGRKNDERNEGGGWSARSKIVVSGGGGKPMSTEL